MDRKMIRWLYIQLTPYRRQIFSLLTAALMLALTGAIVPIFLKQLVDSAEAGVVSRLSIVTLLLLLLIDSLPIISNLRIKLGARVSFDVRGKIYKHLLEMDTSFHDDRGSTTLASQAKKGAQAVENIIRIICHGRLLISIPVAIFSLIYIGSYSIFVSISIIVFILVFAWCGKAFGERAQKVQEQYEEIDNLLTQRKSEVLEHVTTVKVQGAEASEAEYYSQRKEESLSLFKRLINTYSIFWFLGHVSGSFGLGLVTGVFIWTIADGSITVGTFFALSMYASRALRPASFLGDIYVDLREAAARLMPVIEALETQPTVVEHTAPVTLQPIKKGVTVENLSFAYKNSNNIVIDSLSMDIPAGQKTAIVGVSGAGKTTLARLFTRLYDPDNGVVKYDGIDVRSVSKCSLYKEVSYLSQDVPVFTGTVFDNVAIGVKNCTEAEIKEALRKASADFVFELPNGIHTKVGARGKKLSGGERQRIAIARMFLRNPSVIILDEATSSLDNKTEAVVHGVFEEIAKLNGGITLVVIAHRLSTVRNADQIIVLGKNGVLDAGIHTELMDRCKTYQELNRSFV